MAGPSDDDGPSGLPMMGKHNPSQYKSKTARIRFAVAKYHGMGKDGEWSVPDIADALDVEERTVYRYLNESDLSEEVERVLAVTEAEWRLDMALELRREVERLDEAADALRDRKKAVATGYETKTVEGTPTGDQNIRLSDNAGEYRLKLPVPTDFDTVPDYGRDLDDILTQKRQYLKQISNLLGLDAADERKVDHTLAERHEEVKIVEFRETNDPYPEARVESVSDANESPSEVEVEATEVDHRDVGEDDAPE